MEKDDSVIAQRAFDQGKGILRLAPNWVPRSFCVPGRRIKLHPDDYYALGGHRGGIDERWFSSTTPADNGPLTGKNEGLSEVVYEENGETFRILLRDAVADLKESLVGERIWAKYGCWPMYSKFFDNMGALPHHVHHRDEHARLTGQNGKPEAYYFPPQLNNHGGDFPYTFFGFNHGTPGVLHAPWSLCTYEPQKASDVYAMYQSLVGNAILPDELLWKDTPREKIGDFEYLLEVLDWDLNVDPDFVKNRFMKPIPVKPLGEMETMGYVENWICYRSDAFSAKELTVFPGASVIIRDAAAYGMILMQGHGKMCEWEIDTPALIRFGQLTNDEFFISEQAAVEGVQITNHSTTDPLVMLKHFGPENPELKLN